MCKIKNYRGCEFVEMRTKKTAKEIKRLLILNEVICWICAIAIGLLLVCAILF